MKIYDCVTTNCEGDFANIIAIMILEVRNFVSQIDSSNDYLDLSRFQILHLNS